MSANLSYAADGRAEMFVGSNKPAWHGEGVLIPGLATAAEAIEFAHLGWEVEKYPIFVKNPSFDKTQPLGPTNVKGFDVPNQYAVMRKDKADASAVLGIVGNQYTPVQNKDCFKFFDPIIDRASASYESAGALDGGRKVWLLSKLPDSVIVNGKDPVDKFLLLYNTHDGSSALTMKLTSVRVVCQNTLSAAMADQEETFRVKHTSAIEYRMDEAVRLLGLAKKQFEIIGETYTRMAKTYVDTSMVSYFLNVVLPQTGESSTKIQNARDTVQHLFEGQAVGSDIAGKTVWGLYNAVSEWTTHIKKYRGERLDAVWFGSGHTLNQRAFNTAVKITDEGVTADDLKAVMKS